MSKKAANIVPITAAQLLMIDPNAYINLCLMFPYDDDNPLLELLPTFQLAIMGRDTAVLLSKTPPATLCFDKQKCVWVSIKEA